MIKLKNISSYLNEIKLEELEHKGISEWEFYEEAISNYMKKNGMKYEIEMDYEDYLTALEVSGMENWELYEETLSNYFDYEAYVEEAKKSGAEEVLEFPKWNE